MGDDNIQLGPDGTGKKLQTKSNVIGADTVHSEAVFIVDASGNIIAPALEAGNLATIAGKDFATQTTLAAIKAKTDLIATAVNTSDTKQATRTNLLVKPEREDLISLAGVVSPNAAGVQIVAGTGGQKIKVYDCALHAAVAGLHYFYFGTSTTPPTPLTAFGTINSAGLVQKTFVQPRVSAAGDNLYIYSSVSETNMPYDLGYVKEA